jgi:hypothetical protein
MSNLLADLHAHLGKYVQSQKIPARTLDRARFVLIAGAQQQPAASERLMNSLQPFEVYYPDADLFPGIHLKHEIEDGGIRRLGCHRRRHSREGVSGLLQHRQQAGAGGQHRGCDRRLSGLQAQNLARVHRIRQFTLYVDAPQGVERPRGEAHGHPSVAALRQCRQRITETGVSEEHAIDLDDDTALVVAEALEDGRQAVHIVARARDQPKRADRRRRAQR